MDAGYLRQEIAKVCPIISAFVPISDERSSWSYAAAPEAVPSQITAADNVIATIPISVPGRPATTEWLARWTNAEYRLLQDRCMSDNGKTGKDLAVITSDAVIDMTRTKVKNFKIDLVAAGVLTQERANEIFA
jgi:hypothetical protein